MRLHQATPVELKEQIEAARSGLPFLLYRDAGGQQRIVILAGEDPILVGRARECGVCLDWDACVSAVHAELSQVAGRWAVDDDGLSRNGTLLNGERVRGRRRLRDGDQLEVGETVIVFRDAERELPGTVAGTDRAAPPQVTPAQRQVLAALCRPFLEGSDFATPPTNEQIARELHLSVAAVKTHLRTLFTRFGVGDQPQNRKRAALVHAALESGAVTAADVNAT